MSEWLCVGGFFSRSLFMSASEPELNAQFLCILYVYYIHLPQSIAHRGELIISSYPFNFLSYPFTMNCSWEISSGYINDSSIYFIARVCCWIPFLLFTYLSKHMINTEIELRPFILDGSFWSYKKYKHPFGLFPVISNFISAFTCHKILWIYARFTFVNRTQCMNVEIHFLILTNRVSVLPFQSLVSYLTHH